jgi:hypothetical protein
MGSSECVFDSQEVLVEITETWWFGRITFGVFMDTYIEKGR